jgi:hypothetical protein
MKGWLCLSVAVDRRGEASHGLFNNCRCVYFVFYLMRLFNEGVQIIEVATLGNCAVGNVYFAPQSSPIQLSSSYSPFPVIPSLNRPASFMLSGSLERASPTGKSVNTQGFVHVHAGAREL